MVPTRMPRTLRPEEVAAIVGRMSPGDLRQAIAGLSAFADAAGEMPEATRFGWPEPPDGPEGPDTGVSR